MEFVMGFSKAEIKQILRQKKVEKKMFSEIETAPESYMNTGLFTDIDNKFQEGSSPDPSAGGDMGADAGADEGGDEADMGAEELSGDEPLSESVLFLDNTKEEIEIKGIDESLHERQGVLNSRNDKLNTKTKRLMDSITERLNKINEDTGLDDGGKDVLNEGDDI